MVGLGWGGGGGVDSGLWDYCYNQLIQCIEIVN